MDWTLTDLRNWSERIEKIATEMGLNYYPQEYEVCDYHDMIGYQSYVGMPSRYPHWSFGKSFEKQKTMYKLGMTGLAYEMVINSNPCLAYLMIDNPLSMQILVMAHVLGHNDFFKNNINFSHTRAEFALEMFKRHSERVRSYIETPSIGYEKVERILDAAHAISFHVNRNLRIKKQNVEEQREKFYENLNKQPDEWNHLKKKNKDDLEFRPEPVDDLLAFIMENNRLLESWEKDLLNIVREESLYFLPQMETKIMNEGWASFWHYTILQKLELPSNMHLDFIRSHNQVIRPHLGGLNPYHIGFTLFHKLAYDDHKNGTINHHIFDVRTVDRDASFLRRFLNKELMQELHLFEYERKGQRVFISEVSDDEGWKTVRDTLIKNVGMNGIPVIKARGISNYDNCLELVHEHDGRELELNYVRKTMEHIYELWNHRPVTVETIVDRRKVVCIYKDNNFSITDYSAIHENHEDIF